MQFCKTYNLANGNVIGTFAILLAMALLFSMPVRAAKADALATDKELLAITIIPGDGMNLEIEEVLNPYYVILKLTSPVHNWFAGTISNLPIDKEVTIGFSMSDNNLEGTKADVTKWKGLKPVMTYADPNDYQSYEWFAKEDGKWISGDPLKLGEAKNAGMGDTPIQQIIPQEVAKEFLSRNGTYWSAWREVDSAEAVKELNIFRVKQKFSLQTATIAMRIPFLPDVTTTMLKKLDESKLPGVVVHHLGQSAGNRDLSVVHISSLDPKMKYSSRPVILFYGNEDGDEPDSSWVVMGAIKWLISGDNNANILRDKVDFLFIPQLDPDGSADSTYGKLTNKFKLQKIGDPVPSEVIAYTSFIVKWISSGKRLDLACAFHNVECEETPNVFCPVLDMNRAKDMKALNNFMLPYFTDVKTSPDIWYTGFLDNRFNGWCNRHWGSIIFAYEVNSRFPENRLSQWQVEQLGHHFSVGFADYILSESYNTNLSAQIRDKRKQHTLSRRDYWIRKNDPEMKSSLYELLSLGY